MKILVTGGAGFIGSHIAEYLVQRGDDVTVLDNLSTGKKENLAKINDKINFVNGDIRDYKLLEKLVNDATGVFHEAALASVQQSFNMKDEYFDVNVSGTENIFKLAKEYGFKVVRSEEHTSELQSRTNLDRKSTRLNSSHALIAYAVFCLKKKKTRKKCKSI